jgi:hypothetical protein
MAAGEDGWRLAPRAFARQGLREGGGLWVFGMRSRLGMRGALLKVLGFASVARGIAIGAGTACAG